MKLTLKGDDLHRIVRAHLPTHILMLKPPASVRYFSADFCEIFPQHVEIDDELEDATRAIAPKTEPNRGLFQAKEDDEAKQTAVLTPHLHACLGCGWVKEDITFTFIDGKSYCVTCHAQIMNNPAVRQAIENVKL